MRRFLRWLIPDSTFRVDPVRVAIDYWEDQTRRLGTKTCPICGHEKGPRHRCPA